MTTGLKKGDKALVIDGSDHGFSVGSKVTFVDQGGSLYCFEDDTGLEQFLEVDQFELTEEESMATKKQASRTSERKPKNFRNGDVIKVSNKDDYAALVYVKFGENYYNLTAGGQMKACRYLPPGTKEIITNLSGMGKFFLMSEEELEEQASRPSGGSVTDTNEDYYWATPITATTTLDYEKLQQFIDTYVTDTTEEKS